MTSKIQSALFAERMRVIQMLLANRGSFAQRTLPKSVHMCYPLRAGHVLQVSVWISWRRSKASNSRFVTGLTKKPAHGLGRSLPDWSQIERCGLTRMIRCGGRLWNFWGTTTTASLRSIQSNWAVQSNHDGSKQVQSSRDCFAVPSVEILLPWLFGASAYKAYPSRLEVCFYFL